MVQSLQSELPKWKFRRLMDSQSVPRVVVNLTPQPNPAGHPTLLFAGDFYLQPGHSFQDRCDLFSPSIIALVQQSTWSVVNFEGTIITRDSKTIRKVGPHLALDGRAPELLQSVGFHALTLANNHAMDYGIDALRHTLQVGTECGLSHIGAGLNSGHAMQPLKVCLPGNVRLQVLSFCEREFGVSVGDAAGTAWLTSPQAEDAVSQAKQESDLVIVCTHGGNELMPLPSTQRRWQLRHLIDAGADLVIGHHPHVPQGWEQYAGRYIFYSLGDFYFDSTDGRRYQYRDWGFMVRAHLQERSISALEIVPYERVQDKVATLDHDPDAGSRLSHLEQLSSILAGSELEGFWQQLAVNRLSIYRPFLRGAAAYPWMSFRERIKEVLRTLQDLWSLRHFAKPSDNGLPGALSASFVQQALGTLNLIRCDSHRWAIETALAVITGECEDLRSQGIKDKLEAMGPFYGKGYF